MTGSRRRSRRWSAAGDPARRGDPGAGQHATDPGFRGTADVDDFGLEIFGETGGDLGGREAAGRFREVRAGRQGVLDVDDLPGDVVEAGAGQPHLGLGTSPAVTDGGPDRGDGLAEVAGRVLGVVADDQVKMIWPPAAIS
jgi:hypothetical protein